LGDDRKTLLSVRYRFQARKHSVPVIAHAAGHLNLTHRIRRCARVAGNSHSPHIIMPNLVLVAKKAPVALGLAKAAQSSKS